MIILVVVTPGAFDQAMVKKRSSAMGTTSLRYSLEGAAYCATCRRGRVMDSPYEALVKAFPVFTSLPLFGDLDMVWDGVQLLSTNYNI